MNNCHIKTASNPSVSLLTEIHSYVLYQRTKRTLLLRKASGFPKIFKEKKKSS